ncbi:MAG: hypothetical protein KBG84_01275 [Planctomycetes bacterium]|nr:hypothetical protein [Planctomycetota bacterium]
MFRYLSLAAMLSTTLWVAGCQDSSAQDAKIAALNNKVNELESQMGERQGDGAPAKVSGVDGDVAALRNRMDALERENADLKKLLSAQDGKFADVNKTLESLGGEVSATSAQQDREAKKKEMVELQAEIEKERREKRDAERKAQMDDWMAKAKEAGIDIDPNDPISMMRAWQDPAQREKMQKLMMSEFRKQRNANLKLDEATAQKLDVIEDDTMKKMTDINQRRTDGTITREQAQQEMTQAMTDADNQAKGTLTEEQYKGYRESIGGMMGRGAGMIPGMGGGGMIPGMGGGGRGGR